MSHEICGLRDSLSSAASTQSGHEDVGLIFDHSDHRDFLANLVLTRLGAQWFEDATEETMAFSTLPLQGHPSVFRPFSRLDLDLLLAGLDLLP